MGTIGARLMSAVLSFLLVIINSKYLGAEGVGTVSLIVLGITIILLINNFVGGGALVYLVSRLDLFSVFVLSYLWAIITAFIGSCVLVILNLIPAGFSIHVLVLSIIFSLASINLTIILGKEKVYMYNVISVVQFALLLLAFMFFIFIKKDIEVMSYVRALYVSYGATFIISLIALKSFLKFSKLTNLYGVLKEIFRYGLLVQFANIFQLLNYRLGYYFVESFIGRAALGVYSVGVQMSEGVWLASKSMALVQYTSISNNNDKNYAKKVTLSFLKISIIVTVLLLACILVLPVNLFVTIFGSEFHDIKIVMFSMCAGIIAIAVSMMFSHYFSGIGKPQHNTIGSAIGLVVTIAVGLLIIPRWGLMGAGITASIAYIAGALYQLFVFLRISNARFKELWINREDLNLLRNEFGRLLNKNKKS